MVEYKCNTCNKIFKHKTDYIRHTKRKNPCKSNNESTNNVIHTESTLKPHKIH